MRQDRKKGTPCGSAIRGIQRQASARSTTSDAVAINSNSVSARRCRKAQGDRRRSERSQWFTDGYPNSSSLGRISAVRYGGRIEFQRPKRCGIPAHLSQGRKAICGSPRPKPADSCSQKLALNRANAFAKGASPNPQPRLDDRVQRPGVGRRAPPHQMSVSAETHKPGRKSGARQDDLPAEATAIFPPDSPQGWPASGLQTRHRSTTWMGRARTVNTLATPSHGSWIDHETTEYNEFDDPIARWVDNALTAVWKPGAKIG